MEALLRELTERYLKETIGFCSQFVHPAPKKGLTSILQKLRKILGDVPGRPRTEDVEVGIDKECEDIFHGFLQQYRRKYGLRVRVFSEHKTYGDPDPEYLCAIDPFDGSGIFRRGLTKEWYSVLTFFNLSCEPVCGGAVDIITKERFIAGPNGIFRTSENGKSIKVSPSRKRILDDNTVIAAYLMNRDYRRDWEQKARKLGDKFPGLLIWPNGGACVYHLIASGQVHAYLMFKEPRSEIDPGLAFAKCSGFPVVEVDEEGNYNPYHFEPGKGKEKVNFFIAACTDELIQNIIEAIMSP